MIVRIRLVLYRTGYLESRKLSGTTISVGNITTGGTGKTPLVEYLARYFQQRNDTVVILTRGYGRKNPKQRQLVSDGRNILNDPEIVGDEPLMLAHHLPGVVIIADANRVAAGQWAEQKFSADITILDDGFQHLALQRDINQLILDAHDPFSNEQLLPVGRLREPFSEIIRADAIVVTGADRPFDQARLEATLQSIAGEKPIFYAYREITQIRNPITGESRRPQLLTDQPVAVICGIGRPDRFVDDLSHFRARIVYFQPFPDHYWFSQQDLDRVYHEIKAVKARWLLTTEKDWMRLTQLKLAAEPPLWVVHSEFKIVDQTRFLSFLVRKLEGERPPPPLSS